MPFVLIDTSTCRSLALRGYGWEDIALSLGVTDDDGRKRIRELVLRSPRGTVRDAPPAAIGEAGVAAGGAGKGRK